MKVLISTSASKSPEIDKVYWLRERKETNKRGRLVSSWVTHEKAIRVIAIRGNKVMIKNAFGKQDVRAKGIDLDSIGTGKTYRFLPYEKPAKKTLEDKNTENTAKVVNQAKIKALTEKQKLLKKELLEVTKQLDALKQIEKPSIVRKRKSSDSDESYLKLAKFIMKKP